MTCKGKYSPSGASRMSSSACPILSMSPHQRPGPSVTEPNPHSPSAPPSSESSYSFSHRSSENLPVVIVPSFLRTTEPFPSPSLPDPHITPNRSDCQPLNQPFRHYTVKQHFTSFIHP